MPAISVPLMTVTFDDGHSIEIKPKPRDLVGAEAAGHDFTTAGPIRSMYAVAFAVLRRLERLGELPDGLTVPETLEALIDVADVEGADPDPDEGKG